METVSQVTCKKARIAFSSVTRGRKFTCTSETMKENVVSKQPQKMSSEASHCIKYTNKLPKMGGFLIMLATIAVVEFAWRIGGKLASNSMTVE